MPDSNLLLTISQVYNSLRYAAIPVFGDFSPFRAKIAAIPWKSYQTKRPTEQELFAWFDNTNFTAIAIITGTVSKLAVLDFDNLDQFNKFEEAFPQLMQTRTVRTRRGFHLYFHIPDDLKTRSRMGEGMDWLYNGRYVIAPPSTIDGFTYTIHRGGMPMALNQQQLHQIMGFIQLKPDPVPESAPQAIPEIKSTLSIHELMGMYRYRSQQEISRNQALFRTALDARDHGIPVDDVVSALRDLHANNQYAGKWEHPQRREREAIATIQSAYSRPPQLDRKKYTEPDQLPNTIREKLVSENLVSLVRVVEGLRLKGIKPGDTFTEQQAYQLLDGVVGQYSIRKALKATKNEQIYLIDRKKAPSRPSPMLKSIACKDIKDSNSKCLELSVTEPQKIQVGRKRILYVMPSNAGLAAVLDVKLTRICDELCEDDLTSARNTRQAMHRGLIQRRPNIYSRQWLAHRLGVSIRSLQRYNRDLSLNVVPMYNDVRINWHNLGEIPPENEFFGVHLEDGKGKKYPAKVAIARKLLAKHHRLRLRWRTHNFYSCSHNNMVCANSSIGKINILANQNRVDNPPVQSLEPRIKSSDKQPTAAFISREQQKDNQQQGSRSYSQRVILQTRKPSYRRRFKDEQLEDKAMQIYETINAAVDRKCISKIGARQMVGQYGAHRVQKAIARMKRRNGITNPVGWLVTVLRSEARVG